MYFGLNEIYNAIQCNATENMFEGIDRASWFRNCILAFIVEIITKLDVLHRCIFEIDSVFPILGLTLEFESFYVSKWLDCIIKCCNRRSKDLTNRNKFKARLMKHRTNEKSIKSWKHFFLLNSVISLFVWQSFITNVAERTWIDRYGHNNKHLKRVEAMFEVSVWCLKIESESDCLHDMMEFVFSFRTSASTACSQVHINQEQITVVPNCVRKDSSLATQPLIISGNKFSIRRELLRI